MRSWAEALCRGCQLRIEQRDDATATDIIDIECESTTVTFRRNGVQLGAS